MKIGLLSSFNAKVIEIVAFGLLTLILTKCMRGEAAVMSELCWKWKPYENESVTDGGEGMLTYSIV